MNPTPAFLLSVISAYIIGSFPTGFILTKMLTGVDIREVGSGNAGATNVLRTTGKIPALITLVVDLAKGIIAATLVAGFFYQFLPEVDYNFYKPFMGFVAICGHIWSVFLRFRGGKGVATTLGVAIAIAPVILMPVAGIWLAVFLLTNYVSLASIIALLSFPVISSIFNYPFYTTLFSVLICAVVVYKHKENINRLLKGAENKTVIFKKGG